MSVSVCVCMCVCRYHLVLVDLLPTGFNRTFYDDQHLSVINSGDLVFGFECPPYRGDNPEAISQANPSGSKELMLVLVVNKIGHTQFGKRYSPYYKYSLFLCVYVCVCACAVILVCTCVFSGVVGCLVFLCLFSNVGVK